MPAALLLYWAGSRVLASVPLAPTGIYEMSVADPLKLIVAISEAWRAVQPALVATAAWLAPLLALAWAAASGLGRNLVLRRYDPSLPFWPLTMMVLQLLRIAGLGASVAAWFTGLRWAARVALGSGIADVDAAPAVEPNLTLYLALVICLSLGVFTLWALLSWVFSMAPLLALAERETIAGSLVRSLRARRLSKKLAEINLVLGIIKLALIVLAMVFSAVPLPFESVMNGTALYAWWAAITLLYFAGSDFFQIVRLVAFLDLLRRQAEPNAGTRLAECR